MPQCNARKIRAAFPGGKANSHRTALPNFGVGFFPLCAGFSCFRNPRNSDRDYRIFNLRRGKVFTTHTAPRWYRCPFSLIYQYQFTKIWCFSFFLRSSIGRVAYMMVFNSPATWAATFRLRKKCLFVVFCCCFFPRHNLWGFYSRKRVSIQLIEDSIQL